MPEIGEKFAGVEKAISADFLPALFDDTIQEHDKYCALTGLPVKHMGLALPPNPSTLAEAIMRLVHWFALICPLHSKASRSPDRRNMNPSIAQSWLN
jgi:hypothetical protein